MRAGENKVLRLNSIALILVLLSGLDVSARKIDIYQYDNDDVRLIFFSKNMSQYVPHIINEYYGGLARHNRLWNGPITDSLSIYLPEKPFMLFTDWSDDGNGGVSVIPNNYISIGIAPMNNTYDIYPSVERYRHLFSHETTHLFMADKYSSRDAAWRKFFGTKVSVDSHTPVSALWSYFTSPRWYAPRWYHEGIACFLETWMDGGVGRGLGTYDEMYYRSLVDGDGYIYSAVGLETEGTSADFQVGATSYLYGTRFTNYLAYKYGVDNLFAFYNRTEDSKRFFSSQFKNIYGRSVGKVWDEWTEFEKEHQKSNIELISEYPLTQLTQLSDYPMGSVCPPIYDSRNNRLYLAANYRGKFAHISYIDLATGKEKILRNVDGATLYRTSYLTLDTNHNRLFFSTQNSDYRGIEVIDADSGKVLKKLKLQRVSELTYDNANDCLYSIMSNNGVNHLVRYNSDLSQRNILYSFNFGQTVSNLDVSSDGSRLLASRMLPNGNDELFELNIKELEKANFNEETILELDNVNLQNFRYADGDSVIIGSSNYTGVQNIWSIDLKTKEMEMLSNVKTGIFAPECFTRDSLIALYYEQGGLRPVKFERKQVHDANSIPLLGQMAFDRQEDKLGMLFDGKTDRKFSFDSVYNSITDYNSFKELRFAGAYPEISGYTDRQAFNNVTPVLGYHFQIRDAVGINSINMRVGISPWSNNEWKNRFHAELDWAFWSWKLNASYNKSNFYDLFGPTRKSRTGYNVGLSYSRNYSLLKPFSWNWAAGINTYGMMKELPLYQEIESPVTSLQTAFAQVGARKTRSSLGAAVAEYGYILNLSGYSYFASFNGQYKAFPSLSLEANKGFLLPFGHNNCFWIRSAVGQSFGDPDSALGNEYFGGFRNNYVDNGSELRYREVNAMPGARIDQIQAHSYTKIMGELITAPIHFKGVGAPGFYPTHALFSLFCTDLMANPWGAKQFTNYINIGAQLNLEVVLFSYMKTTWSIGYARLIGPNTFGNKKGELMLSLKLF